MILFDKTQPMRDRDLPLYAFSIGHISRQVRGDTWERLDADGKHVEYVRAEEVDYESSLAAEFLKSRSIRQ
jgi:hypothetical protein